MLVRELALMGGASFDGIRDMYEWKTSIWICPLAVPTFTNSIFIHAQWSQFTANLRISLVRA
jgi:hypothetical protein